MQSTSTSKVLLKASGLSLDFPIRLYPQHGLRDTFVQILRSPLDYFTKANDVLPVLRDVNLELREGDRLGILGVNGVGKTTLCRVLCGMIMPKHGKVESESEIEAIFDTSTGLMPELTGRENAYLLAELFYRTDLSKESIEEALTFSELGVFLDAPYKTYSKGMQARLALSMISITVSDVLILDEVFDGADIFFKEKIALRMKQKIERSGAVIFVSHSPDQVKDLCNRVVVFHKGTIVFDGTPDEGLAFYRSEISGPFGH